MVFDRGTGTEKAPGRRSKGQGEERAAGLVAACCVAVTSNFLFFGGFGTYNACKKSKLRERRTSAEKEWDSLLHPYFSFDSDDAYEPALLKVLTLFSSIAAVRCAVPTSIGHNTFIIMTHASSPTCAAAPKCHCPSICPSISSINSKSSPVFFCSSVRPSVSLPSIHASFLCA